MNKIAYGFLFTSMIFLAACTATGEKFKEASNDQTEKAKLYVFRPSTPPYLLTPTILINNVDVAELKNKSFFEINLAPGQKSIKSDWSFLSGVPDGEITFEAGAGERYFVYVSSTANLAGFLPAGGGGLTPITDNKGSISLVAEEFALEKMSACKELKIKKHNL